MHIENNSSSSQVTLIDNCGRPQGRGTAGWHARRLYEFALLWDPLLGLNAPSTIWLPTNHLTSNYTG